MEGQGNNAQLNGDETTQYKVALENDKLTTKFGLMTKIKWKLVSILYDMDALSSSSGRLAKPVPEYKYVRLEMKPDQFDASTNTIMLFAEVMFVFAFFVLIYCHYNCIHIYVHTII